jgi:hypothetical protein
MQYTLRDVLITRFGVSQTDGIMFESGMVAGAEFCRNILDTGLDFDAFISNRKEKLIELNIGVLNIEKADIEKMEFVMTVSEDLDCSGLPVSGESICTYDEGFISGILNTYTGKDFDVKEIDCWATGERTCRFRALVKE